MANVSPWLYRAATRAAVGIAMLAWVFSGWPQLASFPPRVPNALAAQYLVDDTVYDATTQFNSSPSTAFTTATTGYTFYVDSNNDVVYSKTTDGGQTWGGAVPINSGAPAVVWVNVAIWHDQWTPGDSSGTKIHIVAVNTTDDDFYYNYLDTSDDSIRSGGWVAAIAGTQYDISADGPGTIAKATDGDLFIAGSGNLGGNATRVYTSTNGGDNWSNTSFTYTAGLDDGDFAQLLPLSGGDILILLHDTTANAIGSKEYDQVSGWINQQLVVDPVAENASYDELWGASLYKATGDVYLAAGTYTANPANDLKLYKFTESSRSWAEKTDIVTNSSYAIDVKVTVDQSNGDLYAAYILGVVGSDTSILYKKSTDDGASWSPASVDLNSAIDDYRYLRVSPMNAPGDIMYLTWLDDDDDDIFGSPITSSFATSPLPSAAQVDLTILDATDEYNPGPSIVYIDSDKGYIFYVDSTGDVVYSKTTDGGETWGTAVPIDGATPAVAWANLAVWYDRWTPGDTTGTKIHIAAINDTVGDEDIYYHSLDTNGDQIDANGWQAAILTTTWTVAGDSGPGITKATDGTIYISGAGTIDGVGKSVVYSCSGSPISCSDTSFSGTASARGDFMQLLPLSSGAILHLGQDVSANTIRSMKYSGGWSDDTVVATAIENATYDVSFGASLYTADNDIYVALTNNYNNAAGDVEVYRRDAGTGSWSQLANVVTDYQQLLQPSIAVDQATGDLYVVYIRGTAIGATMEVYFKASLDDGATWGGETQLNTIGDDIKNVRTNLTGTSRLAAVWYNDDLNDLVTNSMGITKFDQASYRFFGNQNSTDVGAALAAQDTAATLASAGQQFRLRLLVNVDVAVAPLSTHSPKLQYAVKSGTCDTSFVGESYQDVSDSSGDIRFYDNAAVSDGAALTENTADPTDPPHTVITQSYEEANPFTNDQGAVFRNRDGKWDFSLVDYSAPAGTSYCFRVVRNSGATLNTYTVIPEISTPAAAISISLSTDGAVALGTVPLGQTQDTSPSGLNDPETVSVDAGPADLDVKSTAFTEGGNTWALGASSGSNQVVWEFTSSTEWSTFAVANSLYPLDAAVAQGQSRNVYLKITMPSATDSYLQYAATVTVVASAP